MVSPELNRPLRSEEDARSDLYASQAFDLGAEALGILFTRRTSDDDLTKIADLLRRASDLVHKARLARGHQSERLSLDVRGNEGDR